MVVVMEKVKGMFLDFGGVVGVGGGLHEDGGGRR